MRLALSQVEAALRDPAAWARKLAADEKREGGDSRPGALLHAIGKYHRNGEDAPFARDYLDGRLEKFKGVAGNEETRSQLDWYIDDWEARSAARWLWAKLDLTVAVRTQPWVRDDFRCTGRVTRLDVVPTGGYAAWVMTQKAAAERLGSIEPLLLQAAMAEHLNVPTSEVAVGVYGFQDRFVGLASGDAAAVQSALEEFWRLLRALRLEKSP